MSTEPYRTPTCIDTTTPALQAELATTKDELAALRKTYLAQRRMNTVAKAISLQVAFTGSSMAAAFVLASVVDLFATGGFGSLAAFNVFWVFTGIFTLMASIMGHIDAGY